MQEKTTYRSPKISVIGLKTGDIVTFSNGKDTVANDKDWDQIRDQATNGGVQ